MRHIIKHSGWMIGMVLLFSGATVLAGNDDVTLAEINLGRHVHGPEVDADDLAGKVVVFEYWGDRCPPCIDAVPHVCELQAEHGRDKLVVIANQVWTRNLDGARKAWQDAGGSDEVTVVNHGALQGAEVTGVPHAFVFSHTGELLWHGHPMEMDEAVDGAVAAMEAAETE